ncbi:MAG TPA: MBOAT family O-acyltransferase [Candidatus Binatia bacterium]|jgi:D-alanyl-lipoteichoic acid acyltransferase DltB (MBOAT superfamily)
MLFNSLEFLIFFPVVTAIYFATPYSWRWLPLLLASCVFYMAFIPVYILILVFTIAIDYVAGIAIEGAQGRRRKLFLLASIFANVGVLAFFKYFNFLNANLAALAQFLHWNYPIRALGIILPIGLSFHTFQSLSYTVEVYRGNYPAERHPGIFALYVMFYPQLVAGPIERPQHVLPQLHARHEFRYGDAAAGLRLMAWGFFKKIVIADRLAVLVNQVYGAPSDYTGLPLIIATVAFAYQIYCDFSGYSDIALGSAQVMGIRLMRNFDCPYASTSISEFWRRWHISLSTWFRDYFYISLGGNRVSTWRWQTNLMLTFLASGLWHGANWTFVAWGALHGSYLVVSIWTEKLRRAVSSALGLDRMPRLHHTLRVAITFTLACIAWIFFRAANVQDAFYVLTHLLSGLSWQQASLAKLLDLGLNGFEVCVSLVAIGVLETVQWMQRHGRIAPGLGAQPVAVRWAAYYALVASILFFGAFTKAEFIYFQF